MYPQAITVSTDKLLDTLRANRETHTAKYRTAMENYRVAAIKALQDQLSLAQDGDDFTLSFSLPKPVSYTAEYDRAIALFQWAEEVALKLDQASFNRYVLDEWDWVPVFAASTARYVKS